MKQVIVLLATMILGLSLAGTVNNFKGTVNPLSESVRSSITNSITTSGIQAPQ